MTDLFNQKSQDFVRWLSAIPGASINSKIVLEDLRDRKAGRGVGELSSPLSSFLAELRHT